MQFIITLSHGFLEVEDTPKNRKFFSEYSYQNNGKLYLEEDCDGAAYLQAHGLKDYTTIKTIHSEDSTDPFIQRL